MKIGIVCPYNLFRHGGVQETVFAHAKVLAAKGYDVKIISPRPYGYDGEVAENIRLVGVSTDLNYPFRTKADISFNVGQKEMKDMLEQEQFDILHFHEPWVPMFPRQLLNISTAINIGTFHAKWPEKLIYRTFGKAIKPYARSIVDDLDYLVAASEPASHYINELIGSEVPIIFNGIDLKRFDPKRVKKLKKYDDDVPTIVYVNRLEKRKGPDLLLQAYSRLVEMMPNVRLVFASDGDMRQKLEDYVQIYKLPNVEFLGFIDDETKVRLYKSADVYTAPSPYGEGFGIVLLEALAMDVPYVAGDNPGYRYASAELADELLVDPYDAEAYAKKLFTMLTDKSARQRFANWAKQRKKLFDYERIVNQYETVYKRLLKERGRDA